MQYRYRCEVCDREEILTQQAAYEAGWDYPPFIGTYGVVSPRTCPNCPIDKTVYWTLLAKKSSGDRALLDERQMAIVQRILDEPESMTIK